MPTEDKGQEEFVDPSGQGQGRSKEEVEAAVKEAAVKKPFYKFDLVDGEVKFVEAETLVDACEFLLENTDYIEDDILVVGKLAGSLLHEKKAA